MEGLGGAMNGDDPVPATAPPRHPAVAAVGLASSFAASVIGLVTAIGFLAALVVFGAGAAMVLAIATWAVVVVLVALPVALFAETLRLRRGRARSRTAVLILNWVGLAGAAFVGFVALVRLSHGYGLRDTVVTLLLSILCGAVLCGVFAIIGGVALATPASRRWFAGRRAP
ncbi:MAG TPA: hypothetical protein VE172_00965 [Stackebrandtia sp.]|jgi:hypothetical protein|uniref:hypothetical protein n=1 Tax=Stackebrandtia sp. TaxID=2023065 RepID=UPI002D3189CE|nr:hypothetical protein [Stackebrandtia sp.]HZE37361.1 hypothetical protein [Stackebrandtia sp.]